MKRLGASALQVATKNSFNSTEGGLATPRSAMRRSELEVTFSRMQEMRVLFTRELSKQGCMSAARCAQLAG